MSTTPDQVESALRAALRPQTLRIVDDSHLHAGHAGAREGRHFSVYIVSASFEGKTRVARHRLVYDAVATMMQGGIHALAIQSHAPSEL